MIRIRIAAPICTAVFAGVRTAARECESFSFRFASAAPPPEPIVPIEKVFERTFRLDLRDEASDLRDEASQKVLHIGRKHEIIPFQIN
jgi:hypothetical protein